MTDTNVLLLVLAGSLVVAMVVAWLLVRSARSRAEALLATVGPARRSIAASALGSTEEADRPVTGTGTLVLTDGVLAFAQWRPSLLLEIPRSDIVTVDTTKEHMGKTMRSEVLRVTWRKQGVEEEVAFFIRDLDPWLADLGGQRAS